MWIFRNWYKVPSRYPPNADGQLFNDQEFCRKLQDDLKKEIFGMCTKNPMEASKPRSTDTEANLIFKRVLCNYLQVVDTYVGRAPAGFSFLYDT